MTDPNSAGFPDRARPRRAVVRLPVTELDGGLSFYQRAFGFEVGLLWPELEPTFAILFQPATELGSSIELQLSSQEPQPGAATLILEVEDARESLRLLVREFPDLTPEWGPEVYWYGRREFGVRDPAGHLVIVSEITSG